MTAHMVTVFAGPLWEATILRGRLEEEGIPAVLPDETIKTMDPFITGANAFDFSLAVRADHAAQATELLASWRGEPKPSAEEPALLEELRSLSRRARWASIWVVTAPYALVLAYRYVSMARRFGVRPRDYPYTLLAVLMSVALLMTMAVLLAGGAGIGGFWSFP
jgi:hypothetical protein